MRSSSTSGKRAAKPPGKRAATARAPKEREGDREDAAEALQMKTRAFGAYRTKARQFFPNVHTALPLTVAYDTLQPISIPSNWHSKGGAKAAATGQDKCARLVGQISLTFLKVDDEVLSALTSEHCTEYSGFHPTEMFNADGEFWSPRPQIPLSRLVDGTSELELECADETTGNLLNSLFALQSPASSVWNLPFLRVVSRHTHDVRAERLHVTYFVYFTRLVFELISDPAIQNVVDHLREFPGERIPVTPKRFAPVQITSNKAVALADPDYKFSLSGVMKQAENLGYPEAPDPAGLKVSLYPFQRATHQWMLDQEKSPGGLNGQFWEHWRFQDGGPDMYFFAIGGEFRFDTPPVTYGGLLCEEMGLGKTVEVLSLILGNPSTDPDSKATLIVVPTHLAEQWWSEIAKRTNLRAINMHALSTTGLGLNNVSANHVRRAGADPSAAWGIDPADLQVGDKVETNIFSSWEVSEGCFFTCKILKQLQWNPQLFNMRVVAEEIVQQFDIVLTTYELIKLPGNQDRFSYKKYPWHRVVLDECQEIKVATNQIAATCASLTSVRRWMVSGTPLCTKLEDLHGELNFLGIWPFCLSNRQDGFWGHKIETPFEERNESCLPLLYALIDAVMMRHSKSQRYIDGTPLVLMPHRAVEWRPVVMNRTETLIYHYIDSFAAEAVKRFLRHAGAEGAADLAQTRDYRYVRSLVGILSRCCTHPGAVDLTNLDHLRRFLLPNRPFGSATDDGLNKVVLLTPDAILSRVQSVGMGFMGGLNYATQRVQANVKDTEALERRREELHQLPLQELSQKLLEKELPVPMKLTQLPFHVSVNQGSRNVLALISSDVEESSVPLVSERLPHSSVIRINKPTVCDRDVTVEIVTPVAPSTQKLKKSKVMKVIADIGITQAWEHEDVENAKVYKWDSVTRKDPYIDLLLANDAARVATSSAVHDQGFSTIYKLMAGQTVDCPLCLMPATRPTVTICVHAYCHDCIVDMIKREQHAAAKCPVCRRVIAANSLMEAKMDNITDDSEEGKDSSVSPRVVALTTPPRESSSSTAAIPKKRKRDSDVVWDSSDIVRSRKHELPSPEPSSAVVTTLHKTDYNVPELSASFAMDSGTVTQMLHFEFPSVSRRSLFLPSIAPSALDIFQNPEISCKLNALIGDMIETRLSDFGAKFVVFSQYKESLKIAAQYVASAGFESKVAIGTGPESAAAIHEFVSDPSCRVLFLNNGTSATGLTLTAASVVYMLEPTHSAVDEAQAISRVHRIGQSKPVRCVIFFARGTIEERILRLRQQNRTLTEVLGSIDASTELSHGRNEHHADSVASGFFLGSKLKEVFGIEDRGRMSYYYERQEINDSASDSEFENESDEDF